MNEIVLAGVQVDNPYLLEFKHYSNINWLGNFTLRDELVLKYSWAIPNNEALFAIRYLQMPICEIGAGRGYWGMLLRALGVECHLYDWAPVGSGNPNPYIDRDEPWTEVLEGGYGRAAAHPDAALFLCWPPYATAMAYQALKAYTGQVCIYVGESWGGCTGDDDFHDLLAESFEGSMFVGIPQFPYIHDYMGVYRRKAT